MTIRTFTLATASVLAATVSFSAVASAADLDGKPTRNWGGTWFGFGAGYSNSGYKGDLGSTACFTGATSTGAGSAEATCSVLSDGTSGEAGVGTLVEVPGETNEFSAAAATAAAAAIEGPNSAAASAAASGPLDPGVTVGAEADASTNPPSASASASSSAETAVAIATADDGSASNAAAGTAFSIASEMTRETASVAFADPTSGIFGVAGKSSASTALGTAEAFALGLGGLPGSFFSDSNGGFTPNIHMRIDHQTESNWVLGGELDLMFPTGSDVAMSSTYEGNDVAVNRATSIDTNLLASARLRMGYATGDYLLYGTGGVAYASLEAEAMGSGSFQGSTASASQSKSAHAWGGVVGGGVSAFMNDDTVVSLEGLYYMFDETIGFEDGSVKLDDAFSVMVKVSIRPN